MYNKFQPSVEERGFDATNFVSYLQEKLSTKGLYFAIQTVEDSSMSEFIWTLTDSFERWIENSEANIVLFDSTHCINKYTLKFGAFCTVNKMEILKSWHVHQGSKNVLNLFSEADMKTYATVGMLS